MSILTLTAFLIFVFGIFNVLEISITATIENIFDFLERDKTSTLSKKIKIANEGKKDRWLVSLIKETRSILEHTNKIDKFSNICILAVFSMIIGVYIAIIIDNYFLVPILAIGFLTIPFQYIKLTSIEYKKTINEELEVTLSMITSSYIRSENIIGAVEENIKNIKPPIKNIFNEFLIESEYINADIPRALSKLKDKIDNDIFTEWVEALILCQDNIAFKYNLNPILSKLSALRILSAEINNNMYAPIKEFIVMSILVYGNIPLLYMLNKDWYKVLMSTIPGKLVLAIIVIVTFISFAGIVKLTRPIESEAYAKEEI